MKSPWELFGGVVAEKLIHDLEEINKMGLCSAIINPFTGRNTPMDETQSETQTPKEDIPRPKVLDELAALAAVTVMRSEAFHRYRLAVTLDEFIEIKDYMLKTKGTFDNTVMGHKLMVDDDVKYANPANTMNPGHVYHQGGALGGASQAVSQLQAQAKMTQSMAKAAQYGILSNPKKGP